MQIGKKLDNHKATPKTIGPHPSSAVFWLHPATNSCLSIEASKQRQGSQVPRPFQLTANCRANATCRTMLLGLLQW